jgi:SAM-dependent methyltransferase
MRTGEPNDTRDDLGVERERLEAELFVADTPEEYKKFIQEARFITSDAPYSAQLYSLLDQKQVRIKEGVSEKLIMHDKFKDGVILDLGCGKEEFMADISRKFNSRQYIGVDIDPWVRSSFLRRGKEVIEDFLPPPSTYKTNRDIKPLKPQIVQRIGADETRIQGDMLDATSRLADNSVSVVILFAIEAHKHGDTGDYSKALVKEIGRVLKEGGIVLEHGSDFSFNPKDGNLGFDHMGEIRGEGIGCQIYEKSKKIEEKK